jgi:Zn-finger nucleic acid-binding protein
MRQDVDLKGIHKYTVVVPESKRICPRCNEAMPTIDLKLGGKFLIERCQSCMGMFFDPGELEALLEKSVSNVYFVDYKQMEILKHAKRHDEYPVVYIKCPVCRKLMNRVNFGSMSGVIVDKCRDHGIWLDGGELRTLMEWKKAGGQIHHQQKTTELRRIQQQEEAAKKEEGAFSSGGIMPDNSPASYQGYARFKSSGKNWDEPEDLLSLVSRFVGRLFR